MPKGSAMNQIINEGQPQGNNSANQSQQKIKTTGFNRNQGMANGPLIQAPKQQMAFTSYETGFGHNQAVGMVGKSSRN